jgi:hypothetical protein
LYAVMSWSVTQRTRELGIRMALARRRAMWRAWCCVARRSWSPSGWCSVWVLRCRITGLLTLVLYEVSPRDPLVFGGVALTLALVAFAASYLPARRAARLDPVTALRHE